MKALESSKILAAIERCGGNQSGAARRLGMPRRTLVFRLADLSVKRRQTTGTKVDRYNPGASNQAPPNFKEMVDLVDEVAT